MSSNLDEQVQRLCREIPKEKDPEKMMTLVKQLNRLLDEKEASTSNPHDAPMLIKNGEERLAPDPSTGNVGCGSRKSA